MAGVGRAASQPALTIVGIGPMRAGGLGARVALHWSPGSGVGLVGETQLQRKTRDGTWIAIASADAGSPMETDLVAGRRYNLRVRSLDEAGNVLDSRRLRVILASRDWASSRIERTPGDWSTTNGGSRLGGALASISADAAISTDFSGAGVALLAPVGPTGGAMRVRIDGGDWVRGDLRDLQPADRALVFSQDLENGTHTLDIAVDEGTIALDSMLFVRTPAAWARRS